MQQYADDDPDYASDAVDDSPGEALPEPTDPATIPLDEVDTDAPHKHGGAQ